jgi:spermidine synthase
MNPGRKPLKDLNRADEKTASWSLLLCLAFFFSGFCGLIYQIVWIRKFSLIFGSTISAMSIVISIFFFGLAAGSWIFGRRSVTSGYPVRLYGILELLVGAYALIFPAIMGAVEAGYSFLYPSLSSTPALLLLTRISLSLAVLILPTVLMGGTLPILTKHFVRTVSSAGGETGRLYGVNALGAAAGALFSGYVLLQNLGVNGTNTAAGVVNIVLGLVALAAGWRPNPGRLRPEPGGWVAPEQGKGTAERDSLVTLTVYCFAASGFVSMAYEIAWLRYLLFFFRDTIYLYTGIIALFITGIGAGSLLYRRVFRDIRAPVSLFGYLQLGIGLSTLVAMYIPIFWHQSILDAGERSGGIVLVLLSVMLVIPTLFMGATFPLVTRIISRELQTVGRQVGRAYALNTAGSILGSFAAGFIFLPFLGLQTTLYILFGMNMIIAAVLTAKGTRASRALAFIPLFLCVLFPAVFERAAGWHLPHTLVEKISRGEEILEVSEGVTGTAWTTKSPLGTKLWENRVIISRTGPGSFPVQGFIPLLIHRSIPRNILGLCFGGGVSAHAGILFPEVQQFDFVDISGKNIELALNHFPHNNRLKEDSRVRFFIDDAQNFIRYAKARYDLIFMDPNPPTLSFRCAVLYTREFYQRAKERLAEGGYFSQVLPLNHLSEKETLDVMRTFSSVFDHCLLWWNGMDPVMIGSNKEFALDLRQISDRLDRPIVQKYVKEYSGTVRYHVLGHFLSGLLLTTERFREVAGPGSLLTNDLTSLEFSTGRHIDASSAVRIEQHLSPWADIRAILRELHGADQYAEQMGVQRQYLMRLLFNMLGRHGQ